MVQLTEFCVRKILGEDEHLVSTLDSFVRGKRFGDAVAFVKTLSISDDKKKKLIACIESYKESC